MNCQIIVSFYAFISWISERYCHLLGIFVLGVDQIYFPYLTTLFDFDMFTRSDLLWCDGDVVANINGWDSAGWIDVSTLRTSSLAWVIWQLQLFLTFSLLPKTIKGLEQTHVPRVVGLNPGTVYWMNIFHIYLLYKTFQKDRK